MVGLLQGVAFSRSILVFCNSLDLAQGKPAMVSVAANQCSRLIVLVLFTLNFLNWG
jgi:hypothetical protein